jgi:RNA polymerase sigma-70 factor, ECF subfamily
VVERAEGLLSEIRAGRPEACAEFVRAHYQPIYRFLAHLTRDAHLAEDLTQETFAAAWENLGSFEGRSSLGTWLHRIAYGKFVDSQRSRQRRAALLGPLRDHAGIAAEIDPLQAAADDDEARHLLATLERLDPPDRAVLVLHYLQELSYRQMAEVLDEPSGTVKWRTSVALERLRNLLTTELNHDRRQATRG